VIKLNFKIKILLKIKLENKQQNKKMKWTFFLLLLLAILSVTSSFNKMHLRRSANGFRVLMSKNYAQDIGDFLLSFLQASKIEKKVASLSNCLKNVSDTLSTISHVTQALSQSPNILTIMSLVTTLDETYKNALNSKICRNITSEVKTYLDTYINDPKLGNGDSHKYFVNVLSFFDKNYKKFYFNMKKIVGLYSNRETLQSGKIFGNTLRDLLKMRDFDVNLNDSNVVRNFKKFEEDANYFRKHIVECEYAIGQIFPDVYNFFKKTQKIEEIVPNANDLIKSISEATRVFKCVESLENILKNLKE